jgi:hypothetical protein
MEEVERAFTPLTLEGLGRQRYRCDEPGCRIAFASGCFECSIWIVIKGCGQPRTETRGRDALQSSK